MRDASQGNWLVWQLADSAFPAGGFAHSGGIEAAWQHGEIRGRESLVEFLEAALEQTATGSLPFVKAGHEAAQPFLELDAFCEAFTSNHVTNRASRLQGQAFLNSSERAFGDGQIKALRREVADTSTPGHYAPVFGAVTRMLSIEKEMASRLFIFIQLRGWISSSVRLGIIGPLEAQAIQAQMAARTEEVLRRHAELSLDQIAQTAPLIDLFQAGQDRIYSRLFQS